MESKSKKVVVPGEIVTEERAKVGSHVFVENGKIYSDVLGLVYSDASVAGVVPLHGRYVPYRDDLIVGIIASETHSGYTADINSIYYSYISGEYIRDRLKRGSIISAKVYNVNEINEAELDDVRAFYGGEIISMSPVKVPRVVGKNSSMLNVLKAGTGCNIVAGRNGWIWAKDGDITLLEKAIRKIEREAHLSNLTVKIEAFLNEEKEKMKKVD